MQQARDVELDPGRDEEERHEDAEADRLELLVEERVRHPLVAVDELQRRAREERAEDRLEPEARREHDEEREEQEGAADADLSGRVLQPDERVGKAHRALEAEDRHSDCCDEDREGDEQRELPTEAARVPGEEEREEHDRRHLGDRGARHDDLSERRRGLASVLEDRQDHAESGCREDDRDEERRLDEVARLQREADHERERKRDREAEGGHAEQLPAQPVEVDLEPGEQEQERETDQAHHLDRLVDFRPAEHLRPDDDAEEDLDHDRGQPETR